MSIISKLARAAAVAAFALGLSAFAPTTSVEAQAQGWSGHRGHQYRTAHRPVVRHHYRPVARHHYRPVVRHHYRPVVRYHRPAYVMPIYVSPRRCVTKKRWVNTYYGPQLVKQRVCYRR